MKLIHYERGEGIKGEKRNEQNSSLNRIPMKHDEYDCHQAGNNIRREEYVMMLI